MARFVNRKVIMDSRKYTVEYIPEFADCDKKYDIKPQVLLAWCAELAGNHGSRCGRTVRFFFLPVPQLILKKYRSITINCI